MSAIGIGVHTGGAACVVVAGTLAKPTLVVFLTIVVWASKPPHR